MNLDYTYQFIIIQTMKANIYQGSRLKLPILMIAVNSVKLTTENTIQKYKKLKTLCHMQHILQQASNSNLMIDI